MRKSNEVGITPNGGIELKVCEPKMAGFIQNNERQLVESVLYGVMLNGLFSPISFEELDQLIQLDGETQIFWGEGKGENRIREATRNAVASSRFIEASKTAKKAIIIYYISADDNLMIDEMKGYIDHSSLLPEKRIVQFICNKKMNKSVKLLLILGGIKS